MTNPDELLRLAERVEQGSGDDFRIRNSLVKLLALEGDERTVLTSLDAVEALRQRLLPESAVFVEVFDNGSKWCGLRIGDDDSNEASAPTEARARLAALLRAVAGKEA